MTVTMSASDKGNGVSDFTGIRFLHWFVGFSQWESKGILMDCCCCCYSSINNTLMATGDMQSPMKGSLAHVKYMA